MILLGTCWALAGLLLGSCWAGSGTAHMSGGCGSTVHQTTARSIQDATRLSLHAFAAHDCRYQYLLVCFCPKPAKQLANEVCVELKSDRPYCGAIWHAVRCSLHALGSPVELACSCNCKAADDALELNRVIADEACMLYSSQCSGFGLQSSRLQHKAKHLLHWR